MPPTMVQFASNTRDDLRFGWALVWPRPAAFSVAGQNVWREQHLLAEFELVQLGVQKVRHPP